MKRPPAAVQWLAVFASGVSLGLVVAGRGPMLVAQVGKPVATTAPAVSTARPIDDAAVTRDLDKAYELFRAVDGAFELVSRTVAPSVVHIVAKKTGPRDDGEVARFEESGSGVIVHGDAAGRSLYVLTNNHVVEGAAAADISINLQDGQVLKPERLWLDDKADVAVLKLGREDLPAARLGNSDEARVGSWVLAMGSPFGLTHSVSQGIISARGRHEDDLEFDGVEHQEFLQTDAAINPGNSGGPLVNLRGEVVGINTAIASEGGGSEGVGFSIPINLARWSMEQLIASGKVSRGAIGVNLQELTSTQATTLGLDRPKGARIIAILPGSPAFQAGLVADDVIMKYNGVDILNHNHLINQISITPVGKQSDVIFWRGGGMFATKVNIADRDAILARTAPAADPESVTAPDIGLTLAALDPRSATRYFPHAEKLSGMMVARIDPNSPLAAYLRPMDVIQTIRDQPVRTVQDALDALHRRPAEAGFAVGLQRIVNGTLQPRTIRIP